jgi:hypothetical protein
MWINQRIEAKLDRIIQLVNLVLLKENAMSPALQAIVDKIGPMKDAQVAAAALLDAIKQKLDVLGAQPTVDPADVAALANDIGASTADLAAAVVRDTPAEPAPAPAPVV